MKQVPEKLVTLTRIANEEAFKLFKNKSTCIATSFALARSIEAVLNLEVFPIRMTAVVESNDIPLFKRWVYLGNDGKHIPIEKAGMDEWIGHLCVLTDGCFLCDPTLDQATRDGLYPEPAVIKLRSLNPHVHTVHRFDSGRVSYNVHKSQKGFKNAPDSKPFNWMPLAETIITSFHHAR